MSLSGIDAHSLHSLLEALQSPTNALRNAAERQYEILQSPPSNAKLPLALLNMCASPTAANHVRDLAGVLLRRVLMGDVSKSLYYVMSGEDQALLRQQLLMCLGAEQERLIKIRICDIVGELGGYLLKDEEWPEVLHAAHGHMQSGNPLECEVGLALLGHLAHSHKTAIQAAAPEVCAILQTLLTNPSAEGQLMIAAMTALTHIINFCSNMSHVDLFRPLLGAAMTGLHVTISAESQHSKDGSSPWAADAAKRFVECFNDLASGQPQVMFFAIELPATFDAIMSLIEAPTTSQDMRGNLIEFCVTICNTIPKTVRKLKNPQTSEPGYFSKRLLPVCAQIMTHLSDDEDTWPEEDSTDDYGDDEAHAANAETGLDSITNNLGIKSSYPVILPILASLLGASGGGGGGGGGQSAPVSWQSKRAGLRIMSNFLEVSVKIPKPQLAQHRADVVATFKNFASDPHPRVRGTAFYGISNFVLNHNDELDENLVDLLLQVVLPSISVDVNPSLRVRTPAMLALINLLDMVPSEVMHNRSALLFTEITKALAAGPVAIQEHCVSAIISLSQNIKGDQIAAYYDAIMPVLQQLMTHAQENGEEALWGQALECCAIVGEASGKEKFLNDAVRMMNSLGTLNVDHFAAENDVRKYLMKAWIGIARCIGVDFLPYLPLVMKQLLGTITQNVSEGTGDINLEDDGVDDLGSDVEVLEDAEGGFVLVRTSLIEEQATGCQLLFQLLEKLQEHFYPFLEQTLRALAPLLKSPHEDVRSYSIISLPELVRCIAKATSRVPQGHSPDRTATMQVCDYSLGLLVDALQTESTIDLIITYLDSIKNCIFHACTNWATLDEETANRTQLAPLTPEISLPFLSEEKMLTLIECTKSVLKESLQRRAVLRAEAQVSGGADEEDEADERDFMHETVELHHNIGEVIGAMLRTHSTAFMPCYMEHWHSLLENLTAPHCLKEDRQFSFSTICDVYEFGLCSASEQDASTYYASTLPALIECCSTAAISDSSARRYAAYGIGTAAEKHPQAFASFATQALMALARTVQLGEEENEQEGETTDNAISSIGAILEQMEALGVSIDYASGWGLWCSKLPLNDDKEEGVKVLRQLLRLTNLRHATLFSTPSRLTEVSRALMLWYETKETKGSLSVEIAAALKALLAAAQGSAEAANITKLFGDLLTPEKQASFSAL